MKTMHVPSGVSGTGKSHYYSTNLASKMQFIDIADE
jgi:hypothetical protein